MKLLVSSLVVCCVVALAMASPTQLPEEPSTAEVTDGARDKRSDGATVTSTTTVQTTVPAVPGSVSVVAPPAVVAPVAPVAYPWGAYGYPYGYPWGYPYGAWPYGAPYTVTVGK